MKQYCKQKQIYKNYAIIYGAIFPVKTLQSIDVTPATLPDMTVNATKTVGLKVIANYLEGTVASTEEVTAQATVTASAGTYAADVFTAPATAADVTLTVAFGGQSKTITVKVTAEAPKVTTVTVSALSISETTSTNAVVLVKDQFGATMAAADYTLAYTSGDTNVFTVTSAGVITAGTYSSTTNKATLTVTATPTLAGGTAVIGTAEVAVTADSAKPKLVKVEALNNKTIVATFSKKMADTTSGSYVSALTQAKYTLYNMTTGQSATFDVSTANVANTTNIAVTSAFTDTTHTAVKFVIVDLDTTKLTGYPAKGLSTGNYVLYVKDLTDTAATPNVVVTNDNFQFAGTLVADSTGPALASANLNTATKKLTMNFDKIATIGDMTKITITNGTTNLVLTASESKTTDNALSVAITLSNSTTLATLATMTGSTWTISLGAGAVKDASNNNNTALTNASLSAVVPPELTAASYDESTNVMTLTFNQTLKYSSLNILTSALTLKEGSNTVLTLDSNDTLTPTTNANVYTITPSSAHITSLEASALDSKTMAVELVADKFFNLEGIGNIATTSTTVKTLQVTQDTTKPAVTSVSYVESTSKLTVNFNVNLETVVLGTVGSSIKIYSTQDNASKLDMSANATVAFDPTSKKTLVFTLSAGNITAMNNIYHNGYTPYLVAAADVFVKEYSAQTLKNLAISTKADNNTVAYTDDVKPKISAVSSPDRSTVQITFGEKVKKATAESILNETYKVHAQGSATALTVYSATMTDADATTGLGTIVKVIVDQMAASTGYHVIVKNVEDKAGNKIDTLLPNDLTDDDYNFTSGASAVVPKVSKVIIVDSGTLNVLDGSDKFQVIFDRPVRLKDNYSADSTTKLADMIGIYTAANKTLLAGWNNTNVTDLAKDVITLHSTDENSILISVNSKLFDGLPNPTDLTVGTDMMDVISGQSFIVYKNSTTAISADHAGATVSATHIVTPPGDNPKISTIKYEDFNNDGLINSGDKFYVTFNKDVKLVSGSFDSSVLTLAKNTSADGASEASTVGFGANATYTTSITATAAANSVTIVLASDYNGSYVASDIALTNMTAPFNSAAVNGFYGRAVANKLKDTWGVVMGGTYTSGADVVPNVSQAGPQITKAYYFDADQSGSPTTNDTIILEFDKVVALNATADGTAINTAFTLGVAADFNNGAIKTDNRKQVFFTLAQDSTNIFYGSTYVNVKSAPGSVFTDAYGAAIVPASSNLKLESVGDTTGPVVQSATWISNNKIKVVFNEGVTFVAADPTTSTTFWNNASGYALKNYGGDNGVPGKVLVYNVATQASAYATALTTANAGYGVIGAFDATDTSNKTVIITLNNGTTIDGTHYEYAASSLVNTDDAASLHMVAGLFKDVYGNKNLSYEFNTTAALDKSVKIKKDLTVPTKPDTTMLAQIGLSMLDNKVHFGTINMPDGAAPKASEGKVQFQVYVGALTPGAATSPNGSSAFANAFSSTNDFVVNTTGVTAGHGVWYRIVDVAGNASEWVQDGIVPAAPVVSTVGLENATGNIVVGATAMTSLTTNTIIQVYYDDNGAGTGLTLHKATLAAAHNGTSTSYAAQAWGAVTAGKYVAYAIVDADGNTSALTYDGIMPAAPTGTAVAIVKAATGNTADYISNNNKAAAVIDSTKVTLGANTETTSWKLKVSLASGATVTGTSSFTADNTPADITVDATTLTDGAVTTKVSVVSAEGNESATFTHVASTINKDVVAPAAVVGAGTKTLSATSAQITFGENVVITTPATGRFAGAAGNVGDSAVPSVAGAVVTLTFPALTFTSGAASVVDYAPLALGNAANVKDAAGNEAVAFTDTVLATGF